MRVLCGLPVLLLGVSLLGAGRSRAQNTGYEKTSQRVLQRREIVGNIGVLAANQ